MVPTLIRQLPLSAKLAVVTADANHCGRDLLGVSDPAEQSRVVIGGIEGGNYWNGFMKRTLPSTDLATIETDFAACITRLVNAHPDIGAILFECTAIPFVAPAMRRLTNLPHYDITNLVQLMMAAIR
ncbi:MAG: hypothetical protein E5X88_31700 [Mesorhizobium sp.]|nr:MAG: hypothetical protein EOQ76_08055 [Mesorhizobium sp.]RWH34251.1 MAG: hypothetical protein EOQ79_26055 [Mesorhizobium sp.]TIM70360.1 MAG: hypothetical protein E5Y52_02580 [Mesorhizobium sp.]TIO04479.1 MAG: hypothetical protein E5X88_31700 [Mesorhizobium sp.]TIR61909.1 MAG: hypothetical protein E5X22_02760 [Mesorhizobium sp.]